MAFTLGVDIGTYETKGVLVDEYGAIHAQAARGHKMLVPQPGWAEHCPEEDWWGDFVFVCQTILRDGGVEPAEVKAVACGPGVIAAPEEEVASRPRLFSHLAF